MGSKTLREKYDEIIEHFKEKNIPDYMFFDFEDILDIKFEVGLNGETALVKMINGVEVNIEKNIIREGFEHTGEETIYCEDEIGITYTKDGVISRKDDYPAYYEYNIYSTNNEIESEETTCIYNKDGLEFREGFKPGYIRKILTKKWSKTRPMIDYKRTLQEVSYESEDDNYYYDHLITLYSFYREDGSAYTPKEYKLLKRKAILEKF